MKGAGEGKAVAEADGANSAGSPGSVKGALGMLGVPGARFHPLAARGFESVFVPMRRLRLGDLHFLGMPESLPEGRPVLALANHVSNWDGFLLRELQKRLRPGWPVYSVMLEAELRRYPLFRLLGGIGIRTDSPASVSRALRAARALRQSGPDFFLSYFPQGRIWPSFRRPLGFLGGIDLFIRALAPVTLLPVGLHLEPLRKLSPTAFVCAGRPLKVDRPSPMHRILEDLVQAQVERIHAFLAAHGEDATRRVDAFGAVRT